MSGRDNDIRRLADDARAYWGADSPLIVRLADAADALLDEVARKEQEQEDAVSELGECSEGLAPNDLVGAVGWMTREDARLRERLRVVEQERDKAKAHAKQVAISRDLAIGRYKDAEAVCDQLREALERISVLDGANAPSRSTTAEYLRSIARAALARLGERAA